MIPAICTTRSDKLITNSTYCVTKRLSIHTSTLKKSLAAKTFQCAFRKVDHVVRLLRSGAGSMPLRFKMFATVPLPTVCFGFANAPWMRVYPHPGFSCVVGVLGQYGVDAVLTERIRHERRQPNVPCRMGDQGSGIGGMLSDYYRAPTLDSVEKLDRKETTSSRSHSSPR